MIAVGSVKYRDSVGPAGSVASVGSVSFVGYVGSVDSACPSRYVCFGFVGCFDGSFCTYEIL